MAKLTSSQVIRTSFIVDVSDFLINIGVAIASSSVVMLAESLQGFADLLTTYFLLIGLKHSRRRADRQHQFGHGRELYFWTFISSVMMLTLTASVSIYFGYHRLLVPHPIHNIWLALAILMVGLTTNGYAFYLSIKRLQQHRPDHSLYENFRFSELIEIKTAFVLDQMGVMAAIFGLISLSTSAVTGDVRFDGLGAIIIGVIIAVYAFFLILQAKDFIVGKGASPEIEEKIREVVLSIKKVNGINELRTMYIGSERLLITLDVVLASHLSLEAAKSVVAQIKQTVKDQVPEVTYVQVELN